jgi:alpha-galactosidase
MRIAAVFLLAMTGIALADPAPAPPPMGWNSWYAYFARLDEATLRHQADLMVESGLRDAGYTYFVIDGGWRADQRDKDGALVADPAKFPSGMKALADYVHQRGLKFGLHQPAGKRSARNDSPGSEGFEARDAAQLISFGVDFIKYDQCAYVYPDGTTSGAPDLDEIVLQRDGKAVVRREAEDEHNRRIGAARPRPCTQASGGVAITSIGMDAGALEVPVSVTDAGMYQLELGVVLPQWGQGTDQSNDATVYVSVNNGERKKLSIDHPAAQRREYPKRGQRGVINATIELPAGRSVLRFDNPSSCEDILRKSYMTMAENLGSASRLIILSISGTSRPWLWGRSIARSWRMNNDLVDRWDGVPASILQTLDRAADIEQYAGNGSWLDPDLLQVGRYTSPKGVQSGQLMDESAYRAHFSLWCVLGAPLFASIDLEEMKNARTSSILLNREAIAVNQDPRGAPARRVRADGSRDIWMRPLAGDAVAVVLLNRTTAATTIKLSAKDLGLAGNTKYQLRDLWEHRDQRFVDGHEFPVPARAALMFKISPSP